MGDVILFQAYAIDPRTTWVKEWPGQVVLCVSQIYWTLEVHEALKQRDGLSPFYVKLQEQMIALVGLVRGKLSKQQRITLGALVVIDVHARDVILEMQHKNVQSDTDFNWLAQLRYYWEDNNVYVKVINARVAYAYEYLGNTPRCVSEFIASDGFNRNQ